ncbi:MAG: hypothetical protein L6R42_003081 [Xanthoria sp. 1 TBL-2021]|nr:MAG: hypothetical protein L6R42_003081 [Xanthoria sp. 1 TBL-2021]
MNIVNPAGAVAGYGLDLLRWLERSGVDEVEFQRCMSRAESLAYPNKNGMVLSESITKADNRLQQLKQGHLPLSLTFSQALGRLLVREPDLCYMTSTTACLLQYHDLAYTASALTSVVLDRGGHEEETKYTYEPWRASIRAVIVKVVESIFLNITNAGHQTDAIPQELAGLHVHVLDDTNFAAIAMQIQRASRNLLLKAEKFPGDIVLWILNHFAGTIEVYVGSARIYEANLGRHNKSLTIVVTDPCSDDHERCDGRTWPVELAEIIDGRPHRLVGGSSSENLTPCTYQRHKLYETENIMNNTQMSKQYYLDKGQQNETLHVARRIMKWLMEVPITTRDCYHLSEFCFKTETELDEDRDRLSELTISQIVYRSPRLLQVRTGQSSDTLPVFRRPESTGSLQNTDSEEWGPRDTPEEVLKNFPSAEALLEKMRQDCRCTNCRASGSSPRAVLASMSKNCRCTNCRASGGGFSQCKQGCRRYSAVLGLCTILSHAVADCLGVDDVSGDQDPKVMMSGVMTLIFEVIEEEVVRWDTWFMVAACIVTGRRSVFVGESEDSRAQSGTSLVGVQYGSLAVLATWLDFGAQPEVNGSFGLKVFDGVVQGIKDDVAFIQTEKGTTGQPSQFFTNMDLIQQPLGRVIETDDTPFVIQKAIFRGERGVHKLLVIVKVNDHLRIVDPTTSMVVVSRKCQSSVCEHRRLNPTLEQIQEKVGLMGPSTNVVTFGDIFACWEGRRGLFDKRPGIPLNHLSIVIDDIAKLNIALALSNGDIVLRDVRKCCLLCALDRCLELHSSAPSSTYSLLSYDIPSRGVVAKRRKIQVES